MELEIEFKMIVSEENMLVNILIKREGKGRYMLRDNALAKL